MLGTVCMQCPLFNFRIAAAPDTTKIYTKKPNMVVILSEYSYIHKEVKC